MKAYNHLVKYHEVDSMQIMHHSHYIKVLEDARLDFFLQHGISYKALEASGVLMPVRQVTIDYYIPFRFEESIVVETMVEKQSAVRVVLKNKLYHATTRALHSEATVVLAFIDRQGKVLKYDLKIGE